MVDKARYATWQPGDIALRTELDAGGTPSTMYHLVGAEWRALQNPHTAEYDRVEIRGQLPPGAPAFQVGERLVVSIYHHLAPGFLIDDVSQSGDTVQITASEPSTSTTLEGLLRPPP